MAKTQQLDGDLLIGFALDLFEDHAAENLDEPDLNYYIEHCEKQAAVELVSAFNDWQDITDLSQDDLDSKYIEVRIGLMEDDEFDLVYARILLLANQTDVNEFSKIKWKR